MLDIDGVKILLDVGCSMNTFDCGHIDTLIDHVPIHAILLSHPDIWHLGGLVRALQLIDDDNCQIYATTPVMHMGRQTVLDVRQAWKTRWGTFPSSLQSICAIESAFDRIKTLRYSQPVNIGGVTVMAMPAGHVLGGAMWRIRKGAVEDIVYSVDFDHRKQACLDGAAFELLSRPTCLIADCRRALVVPGNGHGEEVVRRVDRDEQLFSGLKSALSKGSSVLIPIDAGAKCLELLYVLDRWFSSHRSQYSQMAGVHFCCSSGSNSVSASKTIDLAKGMLEWMGAGMMRQFEESRENPFTLKNIICLQNLRDLPSAKQQIIVCSLSDLQGGSSLQLFMSLSTSSSACILFPEPPLPGTIAHQLINSGGSSLEIAFNTSQPLEGIELIKYRKEKQADDEAKLAEAAFARMQKKRILNEGEESSSDEEIVQDLQSQEIDSAKTLSEIYWTDYRNDWWISHHSDSENLSIPNHRFQMFPLKEVNSMAAANDYGQIVPNDFFPSLQATTTITTSTAMAVNEVVENDLVAQARHLINMRRAVAEEEEEEQRQGNQDVPIKWVLTKRTINIKCQHRQLSGWSALSDGRSIKNIITQINPRRLILIGGPPQPTDYLYNHFLYSFSSPTLQINQIMAPDNHEVVELGSSTTIMDANLSEALTEQISMSRCGDYQIAHLMGIMSLSATINPSTLPEKINPIMIGEIRLGELKRAVEEALSVPVEFNRGDLIIGDANSGQVMIRRVEDGAFAIEGVQGLIMDQVKSLFYSFITII